VQGKERLELDAAPSVRLTIPAKAEYITLGRLALTAISRVRPLSDETLSDLKLALTEACTNSVRHAYREGREGVVEIVYQLAPDRLVVEVVDDGEGFVPDETGGGRIAAALREVPPRLTFSRLPLSILALRLA
jgi:anti-sigma regulatory factor (Ser/Thr protein kinase)